MAVALLTLGYSRGQALAVATATGLVEPVGGLIGVVRGDRLAGAPALGTGVRGRRDALRVSDEIIPETHRHGHQNQATSGLMIGFALMLFPDVTLG